MAFPKSSRRQAWETFVNVLQTNPVLRREVKTWRTPDGSPRGREDFTVGQEPYLRLTPRPDESQFCDTRSHQADILVEVEAAIRGYDVADGMDFWEAVERSIYPVDQTQRDAITDRLKDAGVVAVEFLLGSWGVKDDGGQAIQATGTIKLHFYSVQKPEQI